MCDNTIEKREASAMEYFVSGPIKRPAAATMGVRQTLGLAALVAICCSLIPHTDGDGIKLPDQVALPVVHNSLPPNGGQQQQQQQQQQQLASGAIGEERGNRQGKHLLDFVGLGTGANTDPYLAKTNANCLGGELAECFKSQAIGTFSEFFSKAEYRLTDNVRITRVPEQQYRSLEREPFEYSEEPHLEEPEWDQLVKFGMRKVETFMKSANIELEIPQELTEGGRYSPRFIGDDIADELDVIEDKKAPLFRKNKLKKLFIPLLIILKLFKLKLLLFLPLILGLASFKKLLGFAAIVIPGLIGYFKLCRPQQQAHGGYGGVGGGGQYGGASYFANAFPQYSAQGVGAASYNQHTHYEQYREEPAFAKPYGDYYGKTVGGGGGGGGGGVRFGGESPAQDLAYQGQYRNTKGA